MQVRKADAEAAELVQRTINSLKTLNKILNGILYSEAGGKYDTLSNLGYIGGKENDVLKKDWEKIISLSYESSTVLMELASVHRRSIPGNTGGMIDELGMPFFPKFIFFP